MWSWILFVAFVIFEFVAFVLTISEFLKGSGVFGMGGQAMIIGPVAFLGPLMSDWIFLGGALTEMKYGKTATTVFAFGYGAYIVGGIILGALRAAKQEEKKKAEAVETSEGAVAIDSTQR